MGWLDRAPDQQETFIRRSFRVAALTFSALVRTSPLSSGSDLCRDSLTHFGPKPRGRLGMACRSQR